MKKKIKNSSFSSNLKSLYISSPFFPNFLNLLSFFFKIIVTPRHPITSPCHKHSIVGYCLQQNYKSTNTQHYHKPSGPLYYKCSLLSFHLSYTPPSLSRSIPWSPTTADVILFLQTGSSVFCEHNRVGALCFRYKKKPLSAKQI